MTERLETIAKELEENEEALTLAKEKESDIEDKESVLENDVYNGMMINAKDEIILLLEKRCKLLAEESSLYEEISQ